jgi:hypothetical protein
MFRFVPNLYLCSSSKKILELFFFHFLKESVQILPQIYIFLFPPGKFRIVPQIGILFLISPGKMSKFASNSYFVQIRHEYVKILLQYIYFYFIQVNVRIVLKNLYFFHFLKANVGILLETVHGHFQSPQYSTLNELS